jgi:hypothetical protein
MSAHDVVLAERNAGQHAAEVNQLSSVGHGAMLTKSADGLTLKPCVGTHGG